MPHILTVGFCSLYLTVFV